MTKPIKVHFEYKPYNNIKPYHNLLICNENTKFIFDEKMVRITGLNINMVLDINQVGHFEIAYDLEQAGFEYNFIGFETL